MKKAVVLYNGEKKRVQNDLKDGILHGETVSFFCKNKEKSCAYTVDVACVDGNFTLPACFKGRSQAADKAAPGGIAAASAWGTMSSFILKPYLSGSLNYWVFWKKMAWAQNAQQEFSVVPEPCFNSYPVLEDVT